MRRLQIMTLVAPFAVTLALGATQARANHMGEGGDGPCKADVQALCPSVTPGPGSFRYCLGQLCPDMAPGPGGFAACLQKYADKLSPACQQSLADMQAKMAAWKQAFEQACGSDVQQFCSADGTDHRAVFKCLHQHKDELSQSCQDQLAKQHFGHGHHCAGPTPGE